MTGKMKALSVRAVLLSLLVTNAISLFVLHYFLLRRGDGGDCSLVGQQNGITFEQRPDDNSILHHNQISAKEPKSMPSSRSSKQQITDGGGRHKPVYPARKPRRWVALMGPHDRWNFGDLIFEKVVSHLLVERAGYLPEELLSVGMINVDMSSKGGNPNVISAKRAVELSHMLARTHQHHAGPFDIVYLGGQGSGCDVTCGSRMFPTEAQRQEALDEKVSDCAYLIPKSIMMPPLLSKSTQSDGIYNSTNSSINNSGIAAAAIPNPVSIANSLGGMNVALSRLPKSCAKALSQTSYMAFRDLDTHITEASSKYPLAKARPDCAVMTDVLFRSVIQSHWETMEDILAVRKKTADRYIAVQIKKDRFAASLMASVLDKIWLHTQLTSVFFCAGTVPNHDSTEYYAEVAKHMTSPSIIFEAEHLWATIALIARSNAVFSTSLHVRIMAFVHNRPRVTLCTKSKHHDFVRIWESADASPCFELTPEDTLSQRVWSVLEQSMKNPPEKTQLAVHAATQAYLAGFDEWSSLLNQ